METAGFLDANSYKVELVVPVLLNPKSRRDNEEEKRKGKKKSILKKDGRDERELPKDSTVNYYV